MQPQIVLTQDTPSAEIRAVRAAALLDNVKVASSRLENLGRALAGREPASVLPVGSVEFVRAAMALLHVPEPAWNCYPEVLSKWLHRGVDRTTTAQVLTHPQPVFVKPVNLKRFDGFVQSTGSQFRASEWCRMPPDEPVWISEIVTFVCEWRVYVLRGDAIGRARYDPEGADDASEPDAKAVLSMIRAWPSAPAAWALDVGVLSTGETALVEVNDAWALGLYGRALGPRAYLSFLASRWGQLCTAVKAFPGQRSIE